MTATTAPSAAQAGVASGLLPEDLVYVAIGSLTDTSWYTTQRLGTTMARSHRVLFVDLPATINEVLRGRKTWAMLANPVHQREQRLFWHCPPYILPFSRRSLGISQANQVLARLRLRAALARLGMRRPIVWIDDPFRQDYLDVCDPALVVYHCLHDFHTMPYRLNPRFSGEAWSRRSADEERRLLARADLVVTPSVVRVERFRQTNPNSHLFHMGVETERYETARRQPRPLPDIDAIPRPRIGFLGTVGTRKIDFDLLAGVADANPEWSFVFVGRTFNVSFSGTGPPRHPRLHYLGERPHEDVPHYLTRFDVSLIPYRPELVPDLTLKFFEYMAVGAPLVVPDLEQFRQYRPLVYVYRDAAGFVDAVKAALAETNPSLRERRIALAADHSFARQVERADALLRETLAAREGKTA